ncbi:MAG: alpha/beta hydrolase, partial [Acidobacteria bacterium]|nr:alpha/beta hydrolase [Acidobacteriota bacterium]
IVLFGHSLGGAVAIDGALELPAAGLVVESSFTDIRSMARVRFPQVPAHWLARNEFRSLSKVPSIRIPKLFIHGTRDKTVPFTMGRLLFDAAEEPKEFFAVERGGHSDLYLRGGAAYRRTLEGFLRRCVTP